MIFKNKKGIILKFFIILSWLVNVVNYQTDSKKWFKKSQLKYYDTRKSDNKYHALNLF